jgi:hypothetical protein
VKKPKLRAPAPRPAAIKKDGTPDVEIIVYENDMIITFDRITKIDGLRSWTRVGLCILGRVTVSSILAPAAAPWFIQRSELDTNDEVGRGLRTERIA